MPAVRFVPVISLIEFTGSNQDELPLDNYMGFEGVSVSVEDGTLTISWPPQYGQTPVVINTGDWLGPDGTVFPAAQIEAGYVRLSDLGGLL